MRHVVILVLAFVLDPFQGNCGLLGQDASLMIGAVRDGREASEITRDFYRRYGTWIIPMKAGARDGLAMLATGSNITSIHAPMGESDYPEFTVVQKATTVTAPVFAAVPLTFLGGEEKSSLALGMNLSLLRDHFACPFTALAGHPYFRDEVVRLDPEKGTVSLDDGATVNEPFDAELEILWKKDLPYLTCELPILGRYPVVFDTGQSNEISLTQETVEALERMGKVQRLQESAIEVMNTATGNRVKVSAKDVVLQWIEFGGVRMHNVPVQVQNQDRIGVGILQHFNTTIDFRRNRLRLERRRGDFTKNCRYSLSGLGLQFPSSTELVVSNVADGFPAKAAGVKCGDRVVTLNKKAPSELSRHEINGFLADTTQNVSLEIEREGELLKIDFQPQHPASFEPNWKADPPEFDPGE